MKRLPTHLSTWGFSGLRNVFDQFSQPENRLTHALVCTLSNERALIRPFLRWLGVKGRWASSTRCEVRGRGRGRTGI